MGNIKVTRVTIQLDTGGEAVMDFDADDENGFNTSGTSYRGDTPTAASDFDSLLLLDRLEDAISAAVTETGLWPTREGAV
jgi:hypothetical protein